MKFKCPVCNGWVSVDSEENNQRIECASCESSFNPAKFIQLQSRPDRSATRPDNADHITAASSDWDHVAIDPGAAEPALKVNQLNQRKRRQRLRRRAGLAVLLLLIAGLTAGLIRVLNSTNIDSAPDLADHRDRPIAATRNEDDADDADDPDDAKEEFKAREPDSASHDSPPAMNDDPGPFHELDAAEFNSNPSTNIYKTGRTLRECWFKIQPFLVELRVETPVGARFATGTIVDSRGWLLTSYRAVQGATRIDVRQSRKTVTEPVAGLLVDQIRGIVAAEPDRDLVLLSVNPRFATSFRDLPIASQDEIVSSQYLIQCLPPTNGFPWPTVETRIVRRSTTPDLTVAFPGLSQQLERTDPTVRWMLHRPLAALRIGAPLVADDGTLLAMNTALVGPTEQDLLAVPALHIAPLLKKGGPDSQPLPLAVAGEDLKEQGDVEIGTDAFLDESEMHVVNRGSEFRALSEQLNLQGDRCQRFAWWPAGPDEVRQLTEFVETLLQVAQQAELAPDDRDRETLARQVSQWTESLRDHLLRRAKDEGQDKLEFNRRFTDQFRSSGNAFVGFAKVVHSAMESPSAAISTDERGDTIGFELVGTGLYLIANLSKDWPPMRPDSLWLVVGQRLDGHLNLLNRDQQREKLLKAEIVFATPAEAP